MIRMASNNPDRVYRAVRLLPEEAAQLEASAGNEFESCCPHLDIFHRHGTCADGSIWTHCTAGNCKCEGGEDANAINAELTTRYASRKRAEVADEESLFRFAVLAGFGVGAAAVGIVWGVTVLLS